MPDNPLVKKMKLKSGMRAAVIGAPAGYLAELDSLPADVELKTALRGSFDWIQVFVKTQAELKEVAPQSIRALKPESLIWFSFPKGTSKIQTDLTRDRGWDVLRDCDLKWVALISVNSTWSAFAMRPYREGEERQALDWIS